MTAIRYHHLPAMHSWVCPETGAQKTFWLPISISDKLRERVRQHAKSLEGGVNAMLLAIVLMSQHGGDNRSFPLDRRAMRRPESVIFKILGFGEHTLRDAIELLRLPEVGFVQESADGPVDEDGTIPATFLKFKRDDDGKVKLFTNPKTGKIDQPHRKAMIYRFGENFYKAIVAMHTRAGRYIRNALSKPLLEGSAPIPRSFGSPSHIYCPSNTVCLDDGVLPSTGRVSSCGTNGVASAPTVPLELLPEPTPMIEQIIGMMDAKRQEGTILLKLGCSPEELRTASRIYRERRTNLSLAVQNATA